MKFGGIIVAGERRKEQKNRGAQTVMALVLGVLFCGPVVAWALGEKMSVAEIGVTVAAGVLLLLAIALWAIRTWDY
jgi:hypothetical protein